jgi:hypothetical protein
MSGFGQKSNVFNICCRPYEFLLDFITNVMFSEATFTDC